MGMMIPATRPSTLAAALDDSRGLFPYIAATTLKTIADNPDLQTRLALTRGDWREFKGLYEEAERRGGKREASDGTNVHMVVQALAAGMDVSGVPSPAREDGLAVWAALADRGWRVLESEQFVVTTGLKELCAGTLDLLVIDEETDRVFVADVKTVSKSSSVKYKAVSWAIQEAVYSRGEPYPELYDRDRYGRPIVDPDRVQPRPYQINTSAGVILEVIRGTGRVKVHWLDLDRGWEMAHTAVAIRAARKVGQSLVLDEDA
jgi:hypothetical protein